MRIAQKDSACKQSNLPQQRKLAATLKVATWCSPLPSVRVGSSLCLPYMESEIQRPSRKTHALVVPHAADGDFDTGMEGTVGGHMLPSAA